MPPKHKAKSAQNQHDKRHESGLAPPGKRVVRKHSNGHLDAQPNGKPTVSASTPPLPPSTVLTSASKSPHTADVPDLLEPVPDHAIPSPPAGRERFYSEASLDEAGQWEEMGDGFRDPASATPPSEPAPSVQKQVAYSHASNTSSSISTLLAYYPLRDAISILILLLSLPPTLVLVIQTLFASLTFVPPSASISLSTLPNFKEIFNSSNFGAPALATILSVDLIFWMLWLTVWKPAQSCLLDISQAVIAISLSGAAANTRGTPTSVATCTGVVVAVHVLRQPAIHLTLLDWFRSIFHKANIDVQIDVPTFITNFTSPLPFERGWLYTVARSILGIHILSQGVTTYIRRSLIKANEKESTAVPTIVKSDTEAGLSSEPTARSNSFGAEGAPLAAQNTDGRPPGQSTAHRDSRPRESANKKKRKQANQVRSQQPLWAAIASTKVTFVKEMEQRDVFDDAREASRMEARANTVSNHATSTTSRIWICEVRDNGFYFSMELSVDASIDLVAPAEGSANTAGGIDMSKPFYVRINGAAWTSTRIAPSASSGCYDGEIFGLAPLSSYSCEIISTTSQKVLCSASVITQSAPTDEQAASALQAKHQDFRPSSPTTTLRQSIQQAEAKLNETRNRTKKNKKDHRAVHADIKREINTLRGKLETSGGSDDKQERRLTQIRQHKTQAEEAAAELKQQLEALGEIPAADLATAEEKRKNWQALLDAKNAATRELEQAKTETQRELSTIKSDINQAEAKHERLAARLAQRTQELQSLVSKQEADLTAKQRRDSERAQKLQLREDEESQFRRHISSYEGELQNISQKAQDAYQEIIALQSWSSSAQAPQGYNSYSSPPTPDNAFPGAANGTAVGSPHQANGYAKFAGPPFSVPHHSAQGSVSITAPPQPRGRSSSMLSQYSGFTDNGEEYSTFVAGPDQQQPRPFFTWPAEGTQASAIVAEGSGSVSLASGSTGSNSPRPDVRGQVKPIAPPYAGKNRDRKIPQSPTQPQGSGIGR